MAEDLALAPGLAAIPRATVDHVIHRQDVIPQYDIGHAERTAGGREVARRLLSGDAARKGGRP